MTEKGFYGKTKDEAFEESFKCFCVDVERIKADRGFLIVGNGEEVVPHQIRITDIKVERLQDISDEDCLKEGILKREIRPFVTIEIRYQVPKTIIYKDTPREAFAALIDKVSGKGTWEKNPYVFAYKFELNNQIPQSKNERRII